MLPASPGTSYARSEGRFAGALFILGALVAAPSALLIEPSPTPTSYLLLVGALLTGLICLALPWERMGRGWLHWIGALATAEVATTMAVFGREYFLLFTLIAIYAAYIARSRREVLLQLGFIAAALLAPVAFGAEPAREWIQLALLGLPALVVAAGMVVFLREQLESDRRAFRGFAREALTLATRIRGRPLDLPPPAPVPPTTGSPLWAPLDGRGVAGVAMAIVGSVLAATAGLSLAGVRLPEPARAPFQALGIDLPNQQKRPLAVPPGGEIRLDPVGRPERPVATERPSGAVSQARADREAEDGERLTPEASGAARSTGAQEPLSEASVPDEVVPDSDSAPETPPLPATDETTDQLEGRAMDAVEGLRDRLDEALPLPDRD